MRMCIYYIPFSYYFEILNNRFRGLELLPIEIFCNNHLALLLMKLRPYCYKNFWRMVLLPNRDRLPLNLLPVRWMGRLLSWYISRNQRPVQGGILLNVCPQYRKCLEWRSCSEPIYFNKMGFISIKWDLLQ